MKINKGILDECKRYGVEVVILESLPRNFDIEFSKSIFYGVGIMYPNKIIVTPGAWRWVAFESLIIHELGHLVVGKHTSTYVDELNQGQMGFDYLVHKAVGMDPDKWFERWTMTCGRGNKCYPAFRMWKSHKASCKAKRLYNSLVAAEKKGLTKDGRLQYRKLK